MLPDPSAALRLTMFLYFGDEMKRIAVVAVVASGDGGDAAGSRRAAWGGHGGAGNDLGIAYVRVRVTDLGKALDFYGRVLGLPTGDSRRTGRRYR